MKIDPSKAIGAYAAVITVCLVYVILGGASAAKDATFHEINVERINIREPDGTLRMVISDHARIPGIVVGAHEYSHPNRPEAGMIFYNREGTENGGLVFDGGLVGGRPTNAGSLTFDRYHQDQTMQIVSAEDGAERYAGLLVNDRPEAPMDFAALGSILAMPAGAERDAAMSAANFGLAQRVFLGRNVDKASTLILRDGSGRKRLVLSVSDAGAATIQFIDANGSVVRTVE